MANKIQYDGQGFPHFDPDDPQWGGDYSKFQAAALNDEARVTSLVGKKVPPASDSETPHYQQAIGHAVSTTLPAIGALAGGIADPLGGEIAGAVGGTALKHGLRAKFPNTFGSNPDTNLGSAIDAGTDVGLASIPAAIGPVAKIASAFGGKLPIIGKAAEAASEELSNLSPATQTFLKNMLRSIQPLAKVSPGDQQK